MSNKEKLTAAQSECKKLHQQIADISKKAAHQKRNFTDNELEILDELESDQNLIELKIQQLQKKMETDKKSAAAAAVALPGGYGKNPNDINLARLILNQWQGNPLSQNEKEFVKLGEEEDRALGLPTQKGIPIHREFVNTHLKAAYTVGSGPTATIETGVYRNIDILVEDSFLNQVGVTNINIRQGDEKMVYSSGSSSALAAEGGDLSDGSGTLTADTVKPQRYGNYSTWSEEWLSSSIQETTSQLIADSLASIERALDLQLLTTLKADTNVIQTDHQVADSAEVPSTSGMFDLVNDLTAVSSFRRPGYVASKELVYLMAQTGFMASSVETPMIGPDGKFWKWNVHDTEMLPIHDTTLYDCIFGDWTRAYKVYWGNPRVLVDPYTSAKKGDIITYWLRMADYSYNPSAFSCGRNFDLS